MEKYSYFDYLETILGLRHDEIAKRILVNRDDGKDDLDYFCWKLDNTLKDDDDNDLDEFEQQLKEDLNV